MRVIALLLSLVACDAAPEPKIIIVEPEPIAAKVEEKIEEPVPVEKTCPSPVLDVARLDRLLTAAADPNSRGKFPALWQSDYGDDILEPMEGDVRVAYVYKGVAYTLWFVPRSARYPVVSIWERPAGTVGQKFIDTYSDENIVGCVDFAIGDESRYGEDGHELKWNDKYHPDQGLSYHNDWQQKYVRAIDGLAHMLHME